MKEGDFIYCKKVYIRLSHQIFVEGEFYELDEIVTYKGEIERCWWIRDHINCRLNGVVGDKAAHEHFCSKKELLNKINEYFDFRKNT